MNGCWSPLQSTPLRELDLSENGLSALSPGIIKSLPHLTKLVLSGNSLFDPDNALTIPAAYELFFHPRLEVLDVSTQHRRGRLPLRRLLPKPLAHCGVNSNTIISIGRNKTRQCETLRCLVYDEKAQIPCDVLPAAAELLDVNCFNFFNWPIANRLHVVNASNNGETISKWLYLLQPGRFCFHPNNSLEVIDVTGMPHLEEAKWEDVTVVGLENLRVLVLQNLHTTFRTNNFFATFQNLEKLYLGNNRVQLELDTNGAFFGPNRRLKLLDLSHNEIGIIHDLQFAHLQDLETLDLSGNFIEEVSFTLPINGSLQLLRLNNNNITTVTSEFLNQTSPYGSKLTLDLSGNVLKCSCQELYLIEWMQLTCSDPYEQAHIPMSKGKRGLRECR